MNKLLRLAGAIALAFPAMSFAAGTTNTVSFDADGAAGTFSAQTIDLLDWAVGNAVSVGGASVATGSVNQLLYQANLSVSQFDGNIVSTNGVGGASFLKLVASFEEMATVSVNGSNTSVDFSLVNPVAGAKNFFKIYAGALNGNNLTGANFTEGTVILTGFVSSISTSNFSTNGAVAQFDQVGTNNYPGVSTIVGSGATSLTATITSVDSAYFPSFSISGLDFSFFNTTTVTPFNQANPSQAFSSDGITSANFTPTLGLVNGFTGLGGEDFQFQADANQSFIRPVPEPGSLALVGVALAALGFAARRRKA